ncbi:MAG: restriction endonuclease [Melioribacteraceae bacterium]
MTSVKWKRFEELVKKVQEELAPDAVVKLDDKIIGQETGTIRQIDISVRQSIGNYDILVAIDCKDYSRPVDVKDIEAFIGMIQDIHANKGVVVSASGFTKTAKRRGEKVGLNLYRLVDTGDHDWQVMAYIPIVCKFIGPQKYSFAFSGNIEIVDFPFNEPQSLTIYNTNDCELGTIYDIMKKNWNDNQYPIEAGKYDNLELTKGVTKIKSNNRYQELNIKLNLIVESRLYFGELPIQKLSGFKDELTGKTISRGFTTEIIDVLNVQNNWERINSIKDLAVEPMFILEAGDIL